MSVYPPLSGLTDWSLGISPPINGVPGSTAIVLEATDGKATNSTSFILTFLKPEFVRTASSLAGATGTFTPVWGDFNRDGNLDVVLAPNRLLANNGFGAFSSSAALPGSGTDRAAAVADFDGDGDLDLWLAGSQELRFLRNDIPSNPPFSEVLRVTSANTFRRVIAIDVDRDGDLDVVFAGAGATSMMRNEGSGLFPSAGSWPTNRFEALALGDFDGDGDPDAVGAVGGGGVPAGVRLAANDGAGRFTELPLSLPQAATQAAGWVDADGDGQFDLWLLQSIAVGNPTNTLLVLRQESGRFVESFRVPGEVVGKFTNEPVWADFDNDGGLDFAGPHSQTLPFVTTNLVTIYHGRGQGTFSTKGVPVALDFYQLIGPAVDYNNDGTADLLTRPGSSLWLFRNQESSVNPLPAAPSDLEAFAAEGRLILFWRAAADDNQTAPLTYNVRVGTAPGANDLVPCMSATNGVRMIPAPGNAGFNTWMTLNLLPTRLRTDGFFWTVQAVDNNYQGGPFAREQFTFVSEPGDQPPAIGDIPDLIMSEDVPKNRTFSIADDRTPPASIRVQAVSSNAELFPAAGLRLSQSPGPASELRTTLTFTPATNRFGDATITVRATDRGGQFTDRTFKITVLPVNDRPQLTPVPNQVLLMGQSSPEIYLTVGDVETPDLALKVTGHSWDQTLLPDQAIELGGAGSTRFVVVHTVPGQAGRATVVLTVTDEEGLSATTTFNVEVVPQRFTRPNGPLSNKPPSAFLVGDFDNDRNLDLLMIATSAPTIRILRNTGSGSFAGIWVLSFNSSSGIYADLGDYDRDGDLDVLVAGQEVINGSPRPSVVIFRNDGGGFARVPLSLNLPRTIAGPVRLGDLDSDGDLDLILSGQGFNNRALTKVYQQASGTFQDLQILLPSPWVPDSPIEALFWEDFDLDGDLDLHIRRADADAAPGFTWRLDETLVFSGTTFGLAGDRLLGWADFDNDSQPDWLLSGTSDDQAYVRLAGGKVVSTAGWSPLYGTGLVADFTQDGLNDFLLIAGPNSPRRSGYFLTNDASGSFAVSAGLFYGQSPGPAALGDFDGDGDVDIVLCETKPSETSQTSPTYLMRNDSTFTNVPPTAPAALRACATSSNAVALSWNLASDPNQSGGLTYNVRVGTAPGRGDVVSPEALPDGYRLVPRHGNAGWLTDRVVTGLEPGRTYYWSVQAVDNSFAGGPFAPEASFTMPTVEGGEIGVHPALALRHVGGGRHELELCATPKTRWQLEVSTDLITWQDFAATPSALQADTTGVARLGLDLISDRQFFRVRRVPE